MKHQNGQAENLPGVCPNLSQLRRRDGRFLTTRARRALWGKVLENLRELAGKDRIGPGTSAALVLHGAHMVPNEETPRRHSPAGTSVSPVRDGPPCSSCSRAGFAARCRPRVPATEHSFPAQAGTTDRVVRPYSRHRAFGTCTKIRAASSCDRGHAHDSTCLSPSSCGTRLDGACPKDPIPCASFVDLFLTSDACGCTLEITPHCEFPSARAFSSLCTTRVG